MPFQQISDAFGQALQETVADFRKRTGSQAPRRQGFPYLHEVWPLRAKLTANLDQCGTAAARLFSIDGDGVWHYGLSITVADPMDLMAGSLLAVEGEAGLHMPAGIVAFIKWMLDSQQYEVFAYGDASCENGSGSGGSGSGGSGSGGSGGGSGSGSGSGSGGSGSGSGSGPGSGACELPACPTDGCRYRLVCDGGCPTWELEECSGSGGSGSASGSGSGSSGGSGSGSGSGSSGGSGWELIAQGLTDPTNEPSPLQSTSVPIDCTGANLIVISIAYQGSSPIYLTDSEGNSWTLITQTSGGAVTQNALYYCANPAVSSSQTFHVDCDTGYPLICVMAFSGAASSPLDQSSNNKVDVDGGIQPGSITPSENNCLVVTGCLVGSGEAPSVDSGFAADSVALLPGVTYGGGIAYLVQATAAAVNPTWTPVEVSGNAAATIASFKPA